MTKSGRAEGAQPLLPDPTIVDLRTPSQPDASQNIACTTDFDEKWTCRSGSASSPRSYHRRSPNPLAAATINKIRPGTGLHRGYPTKFPIPSIGPKSGRAEAAQPPLPDPTIVDLRTPLRPPQSTTFDQEQDSIGSTPQNFQSHRSDQKLDCCNRLAVLSASLPSLTSQTRWRSRKRENSSTCSSPLGGNIVTASSN